MRPQLVIGNKNYSSWSLQPWLVARHTVIEFGGVRIVLYTSEGTTRFQQLSPSSKASVWRECEFAVWDSLAICEHLAEQAPTLCPVDSIVCAVVCSASAEVHSGFTTLHTYMTMNARAQGRQMPTTPEFATEIDRIEAIWTDCRGGLDVGESWLFGAFSTADSMSAPIALRFVPHGGRRFGVVDDYVATLMADLAPASQDRRC